ncbi:unnamed protein product [Soboliphyme baturini]|uniref:Pept_C1 domain-containing protein n=1 Tax=Soboliphyme baturini TaxID=241478 RepID=A0A183J8N4_9BILA|nr:unnamed protein product [Soboliphyme baturini]
MECYSCMSTLYESMWFDAGLSMLYQRPEVFTNHCNSGAFDQYKVGRKRCPDHCVVIENENVVFGKWLTVALLLKPLFAGPQGVTPTETVHRASCVVTRSASWTASFSTTSLT